VTGLLAGFESPEALRAALERFAQSEWAGTVETYTPMPPDDYASEASAGAASSADGGPVPAQRDPASGSPLPLAMFVAGMLGFVAFFLLMTHADVQAYPLDIGGRPRFAWPAFVPIAFELGVLCAMAAGFFGYFLVCRLPRLYEPIDECASFRAAMSDRWFLAIRCTDAARLADARSLLRALEPATLEEIPA
jgi:hypothetical protein